MSFNEGMREMTVAMISVETKNPSGSVKRTALILFESSSRGIVSYSFVLYRIVQVCKGFEILVKDTMVYYTVYHICSILCCMM